MALGALEVLLCHRQGSSLLSDLSVQLRLSNLAVLEFLEDPGPQVVQADTPQCHLCGLVAQGGQGGREALGLHLSHLVLVKTRLEIPFHLFLLFHLGSLEHQSGLEQGNLEGLVGLAIQGNL